MSENDEFKDAVEAGSGSGEAWSPQEAGDTIVGTYKKKQTNVGPNDSNMYHLAVDGEEETTGVWGSTVLDNKFDEIQIGSRVKIEYLGKVKGKSASYKDFKVLYKAPADGWADDAKAAVDKAESAKPKPTNPDAEAPEVEDEE